MLTACSGTGGVSVIGDDEETYGGSGSVFGASSGSSAGGMTDSNGGELSAWDIIEKVNGGHADEVEAILSGVAEEEVAEERGFFEVSFTAEELGLPAGGYVELEILGGGADFKGKAYAGADGKVRFSRVPRQDVGATVSIALTVYNSEDCPVCSANKTSSVEAGGTTAFKMPMVDLPVVTVTLTTGSKNGLSAAKDGDSYDVFEYTSSNCTMTVSNTDPTASVEILVNGNTASASQTLTDGYNSISVTAVKDESLPPVVIKRNIYVVKKLTEPTLQLLGDESGEDSSGNTIYKYSFLTYEKLNMNVTNTYDGDNTETGNATMTVTVTGATDYTSSSGNVSGKALEDGANTITVSLTKEFCKPIEITKKIYAKIKPVSISVAKSEYKPNKGTSGHNGNIAGTVYLKKNSEPSSTFKSFGSSFANYSYTEFWNNGFSATLSEKTDKITLSTSGMKYDGNSVNDTSNSFTLSQLAASKRSGAGQYTFYTTAGWELQIYFNSSD